MTLDVAQFPLSWTEASSGQLGQRLSTSILVGLARIWARSNHLHWIYKLGARWPKHLLWLYILGLPDFRQSRRSFFTRNCLIYTNIPKYNLYLGLCFVFSCDPVVYASHDAYSLLGIIGPRRPEAVGDKGMWPLAVETQPCGSRPPYWQRGNYAPPAVRTTTNQLPITVCNEVSARLEKVCISSGERYVFLVTSWFRSYKSYAC